MKKRNFIIGLDIGGTKTECCLFELGDCTSDQSYYVPHERFSSINILHKERIATDSSKGLKDFVGNVAKLILKVCSTKNISFADEVLAIGAGMPGSIDPHTQVMHNGNTEMFIGESFGAILSEKLNTTKKISVYNDANCFAIAESLSGAGHLHAEGHEGVEKSFNSVGIILGTGVGGGIVLSGHCLVGNRGGAGELGHTLFVKDGIPCYCGQKGCAERYLSGTAIESFYYDLTGKRANGEEIFNLVKDGDENAVRIVEEYKSNLALFLVNLSNIFDLDFAVLGGGVSQQDFIYEGLEASINSKKFIRNSEIRIYKHQISDSAGGMGAALLALMDER